MYTGVCRNGQKGNTRLDGQAVLRVRRLHELFVYCWAMPPVLPSGAWCGYGVHITGSGAQHDPLAFDGSRRYRFRGLAPQPQALRWPLPTNSGNIQDSSAKGHAFSFSVC
jgi:hypothetical protein